MIVSSFGPSALALMSLTSFGPYVMDLVVLAANLVDRRKNTLVISEKTPLIAMHSKGN